VNFGERGYKGGAERTIKGETQSISADYWFPGPTACLSKQPLLLLSGNKENFAFTLPIFNFLSSKEQGPTVAECLKYVYQFNGGPHLRDGKLKKNQVSGINEVHRKTKYLPVLNIFSSGYVSHLESYLTPNSMKTFTSPFLSAFLTGNSSFTQCLCSMNIYSLYCLY
jgi:hypothetical protein